jgi:hypothetical protein
MLFSLIRHIEFLHRMFQHWLNIAKVMDENELEHLNELNP